MQRLESDHGHLYVQDGFVYKFKRLHNGVQYFKCIEGNCPSRAQSGDGEQSCKNSNHNHPSDDVALELLLFKIELRRRASTERTRPRDLFNAVSRQYPRASTRLGFPSVRPSICRLRQQGIPPVPHSLEEGIPPVPHSLEEFGRTLQQDTWSHLAQVKVKAGPPELRQPFFRGVIGSEAEGWSAAVYMSPRLAVELAGTRRLHMDGTFKTVPQDLHAYQLVTVHAEYLNHLFPVAFVLMTHKTQIAYEGVYQHLQELMPGWQPEVILTDFGQACRNAAHSVWPAARLVGCFFHYAQAVLHMHRQLGLQRLTDSNPEAKKALHMLMALALLPADQIAQGLDVIQYYVRQHNLENDFRLLYSYMDHHWLRTIGAQHFSVYRECNRTNNAVEGFHRRLLRQMGPHPSVWDFHEKLRDIELDQYSYLTRLRGNVQRVRPRHRVYAQQNRAILEASTFLAQGGYNVAQFLSRMSHLSTNLARTLVNQDPRADGAEEARPERFAAEPLMPPQQEAPHQNEVEDDTGVIPHMPQQPPPGPVRRPRQGRGPQPQGQLPYALPAMDALPIVDAQPMEALVEPVAAHENALALLNEAEGDSDSAVVAAPEAEVEANSAVVTAPEAEVEANSAVVTEDIILIDDDIPGEVSVPSEIDNEGHNYQNYRVVPTFCVQNRLMPYQSVLQQREDLLWSLQTSEEVVEAEDDSDRPSCTVCFVNEATRVCSPCGHKVLCRTCLDAFVRQEIYYHVTQANGSIVPTDIRMPMTCPTCRAIVGQMILPYF